MQKLVSVCLVGVTKNQLNSYFTLEAIHKADRTSYGCTDAFNQVNCG